MDTITVSKSEFLQFVTEGFPIDLNEQEALEFYSAFNYYVNSDDNLFIADQKEEGVTIHAGMKTEICQVIYKNDKITIMTSFTENSEYFSPEFSTDEVRTILAQACHGIITFTKTYAIATGKINNESSGIDIEKYIGDNSKFKPWIM
jgi:hypothetical protein